MIACTFAFALLLQDGGLEVLEGETLYQEGWLFTLSESFRQKGSIFDGSGHTRNALDELRTDHRITASVNYGALPELTLTALVPWVVRHHDSDAGDTSSEGLGDVSFLAKYRLYRSTGDQSSDNLAILAGLEFPTGDDDEKDLSRSMQAGSGSWDPFLGIAGTLERRRWKFNATVLYQTNGTGGDDYSFGDRVAFDFAVGNRFWIEPYPGPAASATLGLRWVHEESAEKSGHSVSDTGGDHFVARFGVVFHPKPVWDIVWKIEIPLSHDVNGTQLVEDFSIFFAIGYRI